MVSASPRDLSRTEFGKCNIVVARIHVTTGARKEAGGIMFFARKTRAIFAGLICWGLLASHTPAFAGPPAVVATSAVAKVRDTKPAPAKTPQPTAIDVALAAEGTATGRVLDEKQKGVPNTTVSIRQGKDEIAKATTDADGNFKVKNLKGGMYLITSSSGYGLFRFWAPKSAPPAAHDQVLLMSKAVIVRAQSPSNGEVLYDENGQPYAQVHVVDDGAVCTGTEQCCPPVGGALCCIDCCTLLLIGLSTAALIIVLTHDDDDPDPSSP